MVGRDDFTSSGCTSRHRKYTASRFRPMMLRYSSSVASSTACRTLVPALFTRQSRAPPRAQGCHSRMADWSHVEGTYRLSSTECDLTMQSNVVKSASTLPKPPSRPPSERRVPQPWIRRPSKRERAMHTHSHIQALSSTSGLFLGPHLLPMEVTRRPETLCVIT
jgi:hypothetical protein